jgi:pSer/pThr/pTyr-binding forkhead associated (FHA) protein
VVEASGVKIGRAPPADVVLSHRSVSREHCIVGLANDELLVTDLNSTNGTYIDDARIHRASILPVGSVLCLGEVSLRHSVLSPAEAENRIGAQGGLHSPRVAANS